MQRTLKREFKELEIVERETIEVSYSIAPGEIQPAGGAALAPPGLSPAPQVLFSPGASQHRSSSTKPSSPRGSRGREGG